MHSGGAAARGLLLHGDCLKKKEQLKEFLNGNSTQVCGKKGGNIPPDPAAVNLSPLHLPSTVQFSLIPFIGCSMVSPRGPPLELDPIVLHVACVERPHLHLKVYNIKLIIISASYPTEVPGYTGTQLKPVPLAVSYTSKRTVLLVQLPPQ